MAGVRKNGLMVLTHLILNDMMKVKGHIARMAVCLQDLQPRIRDLAHLFFHELSQKNYKVSPHPITYCPHSPMHRDGCKIDMLALLR